ncbi:hypothetical protein L484_012511 [Morus notabilis]|uniref:Transmembrane protein n=1 Tax=Morus notabilis TaxID=981085 RepID=W9QMF6_9ROSA|nr:hypothetical protein L484_012511 [Morus notabilis]
MIEKLLKTSTSRNSFILALFVTNNLLAFKFNYFFLAFVLIYPMGDKSHKGCTTITESFTPVTETKLSLFSLLLSLSLSLLCCINITVGSPVRRRYNNGDHRSLHKEVVTSQIVAIDEPGSPHKVGSSRSGAILGSFVASMFHLFRPIFRRRVAVAEKTTRAIDKDDNGARTASE